MQIGTYGVGCTHFPPNAADGYDYTNEQFVFSSWKDWKDNYPNFKEDYNLINSNAWLNEKAPFGNQDPDRLYQRWFFKAMPHVEGRNEEGYLNNWWDYVINLDFVESISAKKANIKVNLGENNQKIEWIYNYKSGKKITTSGNENIKILKKSILDIDKDGTIIPKKAGNTAIEIWRDGRKCTINVTVSDDSLRKISDNKIKVKIKSISNQTYTGKAIKPEVIVQADEKVLKLGTDYTVKYFNNIKVGTAKVTITGKGEYTGKKTVNFKILAKNISKVTVEKIENQIYTGKEIQPTLVVNDESGQLTLNKDYTVKYSNNKDVGTATVTITGKGGYKGTKKEKFVIISKNLANVKTNNISEQIYTGEKIKPTVIAKNGNQKLTLNKDYTVEYSNNKEVGTATATIIGKGNYTGQVSKDFKIINVKNIIPMLPSNISKKIEKDDHIIMISDKYEIKENKIKIIKIENGKEQQLEINPYKVDKKKEKNVNYYKISNNSFKDENVKIRVEVENEYGIISKRVFMIKPKNNGAPGINSWKIDGQKVSFKVYDGKTIKNVTVKDNNNKNTIVLNKSNVEKISILSVNLSDFMLKNNEYSLKVIATDIDGIKCTKTIKFKLELNQNNNNEDQVSEFNSI